jgi:ParB-like chromosome segregation protein Spo0J
MNQWPADKVDRRKVADLIPYARNSRTHSDEQVGQIAASIKEWGWTVPVLIDPDGGLIAGHGRILAAQKLGIDDVPCMVAEGWTDAQKKAYVIADNKLALNAGWDSELLKIELGELGDLNFDLELTGFGIEEMANIFLNFEEGKTDADEEWEGMPDYNEVDPCFRKVTVSFDTQEDVDTFFMAVNQEATSATKSIWFPEKKNRNLKDQRWESE